mmetsp:Transcript_6112/g.12595  ORF Transcript_6112/g.12595 Transcript_6112/m.12595 type:complete len:92 (-) Transcript_6112:415-690(-)
MQFQPFRTIRSWTLCTFHTQSSDDDSKRDNVEIKQHHDERVMEEFRHQFLQIGPKVNLYLLDHPLSRSSFLPRCGLIYFALNRIYQDFSPH